METSDVFPSLPRSKRKSDDSDSVLELLHDVSISPRSKRLRQEFGSTAQAMESLSRSSGYFPALDAEFYDSASSDALIAPVAPLDIDLAEEPVEAMVPASVNNERALVLYKPVSAPLFPGGPSAGSQVLLHANILSAGVLDGSNVLRGRENELTWLSAHKNKVVEQSEDEDNSPGLVHNHLAVVPWNANSPVNLLTSQRAIYPSNANISTSANDQLCGAVAMEEDEPSMNFVNSKLSNSSTSFVYEPWQQYRVLQPQFGSLMESH